MHAHCCTVRKVWQSDSQIITSHWKSMKEHLREHGKTGEDLFFWCLFNPSIGELVQLWEKNWYAEHSSDQDTKLQDRPWNQDLSASTIFFFRLLQGADTEDSFHKCYIVKYTSIHKKTKYIKEYMLSVKLQHFLKICWLLGLDYVAFPPCRWMIC